MCIRDRYVFKGGKVAQSPGDLLLIKNDPKFNEQWPRALVPVSYTHLRAHETVLDLVCRLLLEKKKMKHRDEDETLALHYILVQIDMEDNRIISHMCT